MDNTEKRVGKFFDPDVHTNSVDIHPQFELDKNGDLNLSLIITEGLVFDNPEFLSFNDKFNSGVEGPEAVLRVHCRLSELLVDRDFEEIDDTGTYPVSLKPKYDTIRQQLTALIGEIDQMVFVPDPKV